jgi:lysophospholipase L1-like esterase
MQITIYGDSLLKFVLWENGKYLINREPLDRLAEELRLDIRNRSYFGSCVDKGLQRIRQDLGKGLAGDYTLIEFGGNDCSYDWKAIDEAPSEKHESMTPLDRYLDCFRSAFRVLRETGSQPIITNMLPFDPKSYLQWVTRSLDRERILNWLGEENRIYRRNELYCRSLEQLAREENVPIIDLRTVFLRKPLMSEYYCEDGVHPNRKGQELITQTLSAYFRSHL